MGVTMSFALSMVGEVTSRIGRTNVSGKVEESVGMTFADGTDAGEADKWVSTERSLADGATEDLDLSGTLTDIFGSVVTLTDIVGFALYALTTNTTNLTVGAAAGTQWTGALNAAGTVTLRPGQWMAFGCSKTTDATGFPVAAGVSDLLKVANAAGAIAKYRVYILGRSA
jgi:hypothetical protein